MIKQPKNEIDILKHEGFIWVDLTCDSSHGGMCNVGIASAKTKDVALSRAAKQLRAMANQCEKMLKERAKDSYAKQ